MDEEVDKNNIPYNGEGSEGNDQYRNKGFEIAINTFADKIQSNEPSTDNSKNSTFSNTIEKEKKKNNNNNNNSKKKNKDNPLAKYLELDKLALQKIPEFSKKLVGSKNFIKKSTFFEIILQKEKEKNHKNESKSTLTPEKFGDKKDDSNSHIQGELSSSSPSLIIAERIYGKKLYAVYQDLINGKFSLICYNLKEVKNPNNSNNTIIKNEPHIDNAYMSNEWAYYENYLNSLGRVFGFMPFLCYGNRNNVYK